MAPDMDDPTQRLRTAASVRHRHEDRPSAQVVHDDLHTVRAPAADRGHARAPATTTASRRTRPSLRGQAARRVQEVRPVKAVALAIALALVAALAVRATAATDRPDALPYPSSLAAIGDSWTGPYVAADSWATGTNRTVKSQYL